MKRRKCRNKQIERFIMAPVGSSSLLLRQPIHAVQEKMRLLTASVCRHFNWCIHRSKGASDVLAFATKFPPQMACLIAIYGMEEFNPVNQKRVCINAYERMYNDCNGRRGHMRARQETSTSHKQTHMGLSSPHRTSSARAASTGPVRSSEQ